MEELIIIFSKLILVAILSFAYFRQKFLKNILKKHDSKSSNMTNEREHRINLKESSSNRKDSGFLPLVEESDGKLQLNEETIKVIFGNNKELADIDVALLPIIGTERCGKSFTLNYIIRFLESESFGKENEELKGFEWTSGTEPQTKGIYVWRKPFFKKINNKKCAVILMDTQGTFGDKSDEDGVIVPFALAVSTLTVYNVMKDLNSNHLQPFEIFLKRANTGTNIFHKLVILVRDWTLSDSHGFVEGRRYLIQKMNGRDKNCYKFIESNMNTNLCYLWPPPHNKMNGKHFKGKLSELDETFKSNMYEVIPRIVQELLLGTKLKGREIGPHLIQCFRAIEKKEKYYSLVEVYSSTELGNVIRFIINETKVKFNSLIKNVEKDKTPNYSEMLKKLAVLRDNLQVKAIEDFQNQTDQRGDIFNEKINLLKSDLEMALNDIEKTFLSVLCYECLRKLRTHNNKELEIFIKKGFLGNIFTRKSKIISKSEELERIVNEEFKNYPELREIFSDQSIIDFADNLNDTLQNHKGRQIKTGISCVATVVFTVAGGLIGLALGGGAVVAKAGSKLGETVAKEAVEEVAESGVKKVVPGMFGGLGGMASDKLFKNGFDSIKKWFTANNTENANNFETQYQPQTNRNDTNDFLKHLKDLLIIINRYLIIGGDIESLLLQAKEAEKKFAKKTFWGLIFA